jgi:antitoxin ParD1/3/4
MSNIEKLSIALPHDMVEAIRDAVEQGEYATTSEVIRDALRDWRLKRKVEAMEIVELRRLVDDGIASGPSVDAENVFARLLAKYGGQPKGRKAHETSETVAARRKRS